MLRETSDPTCMESSVTGGGEAAGTGEGEVEGNPRKEPSPGMEARWREAEGPAEAARESEDLSHGIDNRPGQAAWVLAGRRMPSRCSRAGSSQSAETPSAEASFRIRSYLLQIRRKPHLVGS